MSVALGWYRSVSTSVVVSDALQTWNFTNQLFDLEPFRSFFITQKRLSSLDMLTYTFTLFSWRRLVP